MMHKLSASYHVVLLLPYFVLLNYVTLVTSTPPSNDTGSSAYISGDIEVIVTSLTSGLEYMYLNRNKVNLDAIIGTRIVEGWSLKLSSGNIVISFYH